MFLDKDQTVTFCTALSSHYGTLWDAVESRTGLCRELDRAVWSAVGCCGMLGTLWGTVESYRDYPITVQTWTVLCR